MTKKKNDQLLELTQEDQKVYLQVYKRFPLALKKGKGVYVKDFNGKKYLDAFAGIAVNSLGHAHPKVVKAITKQAQKLIHISNFYVSKPQVELSKKMLKTSGMDRVFFANSGAEAVEGAIKLARKYANSKGKKGNIISMEGCFHGRTLGTIATGKKKYQAGFEPIPGGFKQVPFNDIQKLTEAVDKDTAAIIIEPIQGEGGINIATKEFLETARKLSVDHDAVLIFDEVQSGVGRTGKFFAYEHTGIQPDIVTLAKSLGSGIPIGAVLLKQHIADAIDYGQHGTTFGGNPLACAAGLATIEVLKKEKLIEKAAKKGEYMMKHLNELAPSIPVIKEVRDKGLMIGIELTIDGREVVQKMLKKGILANVTAEKVIRFVPPLIITKKEIDQIIDVFVKSVKEATKNENN
ncbi:MAG: acetylornithine transaminase [Bacteroidota bacterium]